MGPPSAGFFGFSGLDITILDYGLSRGEDLSIEKAKPVAFDLERDLSLFTSTHAAQCKVYRRMRSFLLRADRTYLPPKLTTRPTLRVLTDNSHGTHMLHTRMCFGWHTSTNT